MIVGTGLDLVPVDRLAGFHRRRGDEGLLRLFTGAELDYCRGAASFAASLAARFAAKEAFFKALGTGFGRGGRWTDVEVVRDELGAPALRLSGRALACAGRLGARRWHLSLTHTDQIAAATVILES